MNYSQKMIADNLRDIIVNSLNIPMKPDEISDEIALFNEGLGLDSIDSLELVAAIDEKYGVSLTSEHRPHFVNLNKLSKFILDCMEESNEQVT